jgi:hypothetical protein
MSQQIEDHFVKQFTAGITHLAEQKMSRFRPNVMEETIVPGDRAFFDQLGSVTATKVTTRHADTPLTDTPHSRRMVTPAPFKHADLIDKADKIRTLNDPTNAYVVAFARAFGRAIDDEIIAAAFATAYTGVDGTGTETWASLTAAQTIGTGTAFTLDKIVKANKILRAAEHDPEEGFNFAASQEQFEDMLLDSTITSADYNSVRALMMQFEDMLLDSTITSADYNSVRALMIGEIQSFMGFNWIPTERLGTTGGERRCIAWAKNSLLLGVAENPQGRISERADKNYSTQVYYEMDIGATRMQGDGVVEVLTTE